MELRAAVDDGQERQSAPSPSLLVSRGLRGSGVHDTAAKMRVWKMFLLTYVS
jgi:hypothetical protein